MSTEPLIAALKDDLEALVSKAAVHRDRARAEVVWGRQVAQELAEKIHLLRQKLWWAEEAQRLSHKQPAIRTRSNCLPIMRMRKTFF